MSDESEFTPSPVFLELRPKRNLLHTNDLAKVIASRGQRHRDLAVQVRGLVARGYINAVGRDSEDSRGPLLFSADAALTAAALLAATDLGLSGKDQMARLAVVMQGWQNYVPPKGEPKNPAAYMLLEHHRAPAVVRGWSPNWLLAPVPLQLAVSASELSPGSMSSENRPSGLA